MIQTKCIQKFRDKSNKIYGYRLQDINGQTQDITSENLKKAIINKQINVINLTLTKDQRLVSKEAVNNSEATSNTNKCSLTKKLYLTICNNKRFKILNDYKIQYKYDNESNRLYIKEQFVPSFGLDLTQYFFNDDDKVQQIVITDKDNCFYVYINNKITLKTSDMLLVLNALNIVDKRLELIETLDNSVDFIVESFSNFCGTAGWTELVDLFKTETSIGYDQYIPINLLKVCIMEMKYGSIEKNKQKLNSAYSGYIFRGQSSTKFDTADQSFKSATTSMNVVQRYGKEGVILAIKDARLCDIIDATIASSYDKDYIYYEHEVLIRDFGKLTVGNQIGVINEIPIYTASLEMPPCNRLKLIKDNIIKKYGNKKQLHTVLNILNNIRSVYNIDTLGPKLSVYGYNDNKVCIEFGNNDTVIMNGIEYTNTQDIFKEYNSIIN